MKTQVKNLLLFSFVFAATLIAAQPAQAQIGFAGGLNFENVSDVDFADEQATFDNATGYHIGLFYDFAVGPVGIRPGVFYRQINSLEFQAADVLDASREIDLNMVEIPVDLRFRMMLPVIRPYLLAGPVFTFANTSEEDFEDIVKEFYVAGNVGVGVEISPPILGFTLFPEVRYGFGLSGFLEDEFTVGGVSFEAEDSQRLTTLMLRLGVIF